MCFGVSMPGRKIIKVNEIRAGRKHYSLAIGKKKSSISTSDVDVVMFLCYLGQPMQNV